MKMTEQEERDFSEALTPLSKETLIFIIIDITNTLRKLKAKDKPFQIGGGMTTVRCNMDDCTYLSVNGLCNSEEIEVNSTQECSWYEADED